MTETTADWPVSLTGVTETIVTTRGPSDRWNVAALGLFAGNPVTARTWGKTRTRQNFQARGTGYIQFTTDPVDFVDAACSIREAADPILESAAAWTRVTVEAIDDGTTEDTTWVEWAVYPTDSTIRKRSIPTTNRGYYAVIEATIAVSRLDVAAYDEETLHDRLEYYTSVVARCGGPREQTAIDRLRTHTDLSF